jgi:formate dehydrogenase iron-sulfur subunit
MRIFIPGDSAAVSVGADEVASAFAELLPDIQIVRNGSRGALWLETLVEVELPTGRIAYGPVNLKDVQSLIDADFLHGGAHPLLLGKSDEIAWLASQDRVTFARVGIIDPLSLDDYRAHGGA